MKKYIYLFAVLALFTACTGCKKKQILSTKSLNVEQVTSVDKEYMFINYGKDYRWFETCVTLEEFLDEENTGTIKNITNVFQVVKERDNGADVHVIFCNHTPSMTTYDVKEGFWVEDYPMNDDSIKVTFTEALEKLNEVNYPKPHSKQCVLRKEVGPKTCNPQYIFGNSYAQLYVDVVTGEVTDKDPVFQGLEKPLGEWP